MKIKNVLKNRVIDEKDAVMFDIDDTLIFTSGVANVEMIQLLYYARNLGYKIVIITARPTNELTARITKIQLQKYKIPYDFLYITPAENKGNVKVQTGLNYILSVGDQETDLTNTLHAIKIHIN